MRLRTIFICNLISGCAWVGKHCLGNIEGQRTLRLTANKSGFLSRRDGHSVYWESLGNPAGEPLLLVHGGFGFTLDPARLPGLDLTARHVIVLHQRGAGRSLPRGETAHNTIMNNVQDMERLRRHLRIPAWAIFAWSSGAVLMAAYAAAYPRRCRALTAYAPYLGSDEDYEVIRQKAPARGAAYFAFHGAKIGGDVVRSVFNKAAAPDRATQLKTAFAAAALWDRTLDEQAFYNSKSAPEWDDYFAQYRMGAALDRELHEDLPRFLAAAPVTAPVTLIYGDEDLWSAPHEYAAAVFPRAQKKLIPGAGHDVHGVDLRLKL